MAEYDTSSFSLLFCTVLLKISHERWDLRHTLEEASTFFSISKNLISSSSDTKNPTPKFKISAPECFCFLGLICNEFNWKGPPNPPTFPPSHCTALWLLYFSSNETHHRVIWHGNVTVWAQQLTSLMPKSEVDTKGSSLASECWKSGWSEEINMAQLLCTHCNWWTRGLGRLLLD